MRSSPARIATSRPRSISPMRRASASPGSRRTRSTPRIPMRLFVDSHVQPIFGTLTGPDGRHSTTACSRRRVQPGKRYPGLLHVYGGPARPAGDRRAGTATCRLQDALVDQGWIVFTLDNRGHQSARHEVRERRSTTRWAMSRSQDQLAGVEWLKRQPFVDPGKIAVMGWSYGGYMTLKLLEKAPGVFAAGVAGRAGHEVGAIRHRLHRAVSRQSRRSIRSPIRPQTRSTMPRKSPDPLLLIHGMSDDNVVFQNSTELYARLQQAKQSVRDDGLSWARPTRSLARGRRRTSGRRSPAFSTTRCSKKPTSRISCL